MYDLSPDSSSPPPRFVLCSDKLSWLTWRYLALLAFVGVTLASVARVSLREIAGQGSVGQSISLPELRWLKLFPALHMSSYCVFPTSDLIYEAAV